MDLLDLLDQLATTETEKTTMNQTMVYCKAKIVVLGSAEEMIRNTHIKSSIGILEAFPNSRINPAYDLDE